MIIRNFNEYVMVRLRTHKGCNLKDIAEMGPFYLAHFQEQVEKFIALDQITQNANHYSLTRAGKAYADKIASNLFLID